ncbi:hypothetical protein BC351_11620 [Paenibacillus ferrarius]|uniref:Antigen I/II N-terminal domain-containing protein n=1 Tax=Paenibacillus ferrarius TaxID=1469647 RepID=A0A1V4H8R0_9BACL|nr:hypothetical protein BC351_11620 [Paenibacillus ferrarius]
MQSETKRDEKPQQVEVDKGLLNVEITLPASMFKGQDVEQVITQAKAEGVKEATKNEDGSITYKMSKSVHTELVKEMEAQILKTIEDVKSGKNFPSIKDVSYNKPFSEFTLTVDKEAYEKSFDGFASLGIGLSSMYYQLFNGVSSDKNKVTINIKDEKTGSVFKTVVYPDALEKMK